MMDWISLLGNALWIFAVAAAFSMLAFARWEALSQGKTLKEVIAARVWQRGFNLAGSLFCVGLAVVADIFWERIFWSLLSLLFLSQGFEGVRIAARFRKKS